MTEKKKEKKAMTPEQEEFIRLRLPSATEMTPEQLKEFFPNLYKEMFEPKKAESQNPNIKQPITLKVQPRELEGVVVDKELEKKLIEAWKEKIQSKKEPYDDPLKGFIPQAVDFIRRAKTEQEAEEIIDYLEKKGEITTTEAHKLRKQLKEKGLSSFGEHKQPGYYFIYAEEEKLRRKLKKK